MMLDYKRLAELWVKVAEENDMLGEVCILKDYDPDIGKVPEHFVPGLPWFFMLHFLKAVDAERAALAAPHPSPVPQAAVADNQRLNFLSQRGGMIITSDDENNRWHVEVLGGTDSEGEQVVTVYEGVTLRMAIDAAYEGVTATGRAGS